MWLVVARFKSTAIAGDGGLGVWWFTLAGVSSSWAKLQQIRPRSRFWDNFCIWKLDMKNMNLLFTGFNNRTSQQFNTVHLKSQRQISPLFFRRQEGQAGSSQHHPWLGHFSQHTDKTQSLSHPTGTELPGQRSLLWAQKQPELVEIFGVKQRQAVSPKKQAIPPWGRNSIFIKILTSLPSSSPKDNKNKIIMLSMIV